MPSAADASVVAAVQRVVGAVLDAGPDDVGVGAGLDREVDERGVGQPVAALRGLLEEQLPVELAPHVLALAHRARRGVERPAGVVGGGHLVEERDAAVLDLHLVAGGVLLEQVARSRLELLAGRALEVLDHLHGDLGVGVADDEGAVGGDLGRGLPVGPRGGTVGRAVGAGAGRVAGRGRGVVVAVAEHHEGDHEDGDHEDHADHHLGDHRAPLAGPGLLLGEPGGGLAGPGRRGVVAHETCSCTRTRWASWSSTSTTPGLSMVSVTSVVPAS